MKDAEIFGRDSEGNLRNILVDPSGLVRIGSTVTVSGTVAHDNVDSGNPVKTGGVARTANPTAVANADRVDASFDDVGRQVNYPYTVRDLIATARASFSTAGEQSLRVSSAGEFSDLLVVSGANQSTNAVSLAFRSATAGGIVFDLEIPAGATVVHSLGIPYPQNVVADTWTVEATDFVADGDTANGTVIVDALFVRNV